MSKNSEKVKRWRKKTKSRIIEAMGGACCICGYNRCHSSLALHHLDPNEKDFGLGAIRASIKSWDKIANEISKCVLLCHNCHYELHDGIVELPKNPPRFDERFRDYKSLNLGSK